MKKRTQQEKADLLKQKEQLEITLYKLNKDLEEVINTIEATGLTENQKQHLHDLLKDFDVNAFEVDYAKYTFDQGGQEMVKSYNQKRKSAMSLLSTKRKLKASQHQHTINAIQVSSLNDLFFFSAIFFVLIVGLYEFLHGERPEYGAGFTVISLLLMFAAFDSKKRYLKK